MLLTVDFLVADWNTDWKTQSRCLLRKTKVVSGVPQIVFDFSLVGIRKVICGARRTLEVVFFASVGVRQPKGRPPSDSSKKEYQRITKFNLPS